MIRSVDRAVAILDLLAQDGWRAGAEVARELGVHRSTALRLLGTLERHALVERDPRTAKYRLGRRLPQLARVVSGELDLRHVARPVCEALAAADTEIDHRRRRARKAARRGARRRFRTHLRGAGGRTGRDRRAGLLHGRGCRRRHRRVRARPQAAGKRWAGPGEPHTRGGGGPFPAPGLPRPHPSIMPRRLTFTYRKSTRSRALDSLQCRCGRSIMDAATGRSRTCTRRWPTVILGREE